MRFVLMVACLTLAACSGSEEEETVGAEIADDYNAAMDKAAEVEVQLQDHKDRIDEAVEEGGESSDD